jgi:hypothetical protein
MAAQWVNARLAIRPIDSLYWHPDSLPDGLKAVLVPCELRLIISG